MFNGSYIWVDNHRDGHVVTGSLDPNTKRRQQGALTVKIEFIDSLR